MTAGHTPWARPFFLAATALLAFAAVARPADLTPQWQRTIPTGPSWYSGLTAITVDPFGTTYLAGNTGLVDMVVARYASLAAPPPSCFNTSRLTPCRARTPGIVY